MTLIGMKIFVSVRAQFSSLCAYQNTFIILKTTISMYLNLIFWKTFYWTIIHNFQNNTKLCRQNTLNIFVNYQVWIKAYFHIMSYQPKEDEELKEKRHRRRENDTTKRGWERTQNTTRTTTSTSYQFKIQKYTKA